MTMSTLVIGSPLGLPADYFDRHESLLSDDFEPFLGEFSLDNDEDSSASSPDAPDAFAYDGPLKTAFGALKASEFNPMTPPSMAASAAASPGREDPDIPEWTAGMLTNGDECDAEITGAFSEEGMAWQVGDYAFTYYPTAPPSPALIAPISLDDGDDSRETIHPTDCFKPAQAQSQTQAAVEVKKPEPPRPAVARVPVPTLPGGALAGIQVPRPVAHQPQPASVTQRMAAQRNAAAQQRPHQPRPHQPRPQQLAAAVAAAAARGGAKPAVRPPVPSPKAHVPRPPVAATSAAPAVVGAGALLSHQQRVQATIDSSSIVTRKMDADSEDEEIDVVGLADSAPSSGSSATRAVTDDPRKRKADALDLPATKRPRSMSTGTPAGTMTPAASRPGSQAGVDLKSPGQVRAGRQPSAATLAAVAAAGGSAALAAQAVSAGSPMDTKTKRKFHNVLERKRRDDLNRSFVTLQKKIPEISDNQQVAKVLILHKAVEYIAQLKRAEAENEAARRAALAERERLEARVAKLRALRAQQHFATAQAVH